jgi:hypothetical protein
MTDRERQIRQNIRNAYCVYTHQELTDVRTQWVLSGRSAFEIECLSQLIHQLILEDEDVANQEIRNS